jgi:P27 family predicted phage terminase small subunit
MAHHTRGAKSPAKPTERALTGKPKAPAWLCTEAKAEWARVVPELRERGTVSAADLSAVELYCAAVGDALVARRTIAAEGATVTNRLGEAKRHPAYSTLREMQGEARRWAAELGLTPASRSRVATEGADDDADSNLGL